MGIIDWDTENEPDKYPYIKVLGNKERYAIESYLFDPILLAAMLLREKQIDKQELGLNQNFTYTDFKKLSEPELQSISDFIIAKVAEKANPNKDYELNTISYVNGKQINVPRWYLVHHGHTLEDKILETFPGLKAVKKGKEELLKIEMIDKVIDDIPELIPTEILEALKFVQKE